MNQISLALAACGVVVGACVASAQGLGGGLQNRLDPIQAQQKVQEQTQQRLQAQAEARAQAQAQNQAARAEAAAQRAAEGVQQRVEGAQQRVDAQTQAAARLRAGQQGVRAVTQTNVNAETGFENPDAPFGPFNPIRAAAGLQVSANARMRTNDGARSPSGGTAPTTDDAGDDEAGQRPSRGLRVGQFTDVRGTARAELARTTSLRLAAISAMRDRAIEADDVQLLDKADRLEQSVRRSLDARARGQIDVQAEAVVESELPAAQFESRSVLVEAASLQTAPPPTQPARP